MIQGMTPQELATTVLAHASGKEDFVAPAPAYRFGLSDSNAIRLGVGERDFAVTPNASAQVQDFLSIPHRYAQLLQGSDPSLLVENLNRRMAKFPSDRRMVRTLEGNARAFMSDGYRRIDNDILFDGMYPVLSRLGASIESANVSDDFMHIQAIFHKTEGEIRKGDVVRYGVAIRNSEVGRGAVSISPLIYRLVCTNGMVVADQARRRAHIGGSFLEGQDSWIALSSETQMLKTRAIVAEMGEYLEAMASPEMFAKTLGNLREVADQELPADPTLVVESLAARYALSKPEGESALVALAAGRDMTRWGLANAVTVLANTTENYDRAMELETLGGRIMQMPKADYSALARMPRREEVLDAEVVNA